jgi:hypothetical protein
MKTLKTDNLFLAEKLKTQRNEMKRARKDAHEKAANYEIQITQLMTNNQLLAILWDDYETQIEQQLKRLLSGKGKSLN